MQRNRWFMLIVLLAVAARGDIIWLANGKALEGTAEHLGDKIRVVERDGKGEYEVSTAIVARVDVGIWLEELEPAARARAQRAMQVPTVAEPARALPGEAVLRRSGFSWRTLLPGAGTSKKMNQQAYTALVALIGFLFFLGLSFTAFIITLVDAFRRHVAAGLIVLLVPCAVLVYACVYYGGRKGRMFLALLSPVMWLLVVWLVLRG